MPAGGFGLKLHADSTIAPSETDEVDTGIDSLP